MTIEAGIENAGSYLDTLDDTYPADGDDLVEGDNHIRGIKNTLLNTFPNITGAVTATHTELNYVDGVTSAIQTQLDAKINTTGNNQRIDSSGTTEAQGFIFGSSGLNNYSVLELEVDTGSCSISKYGTLGSFNGEMLVINGSAHDIDIRTGSPSTSKAKIRHTGGVTVVDDAPATPLANTLYADSINKVSAHITYSGGGTPSVLYDINLESATPVTDTAVGICRLNIETHFSGDDYPAVGSSETNGVSLSTNTTASTILCTGVDTSNSLVDADFRVIATGPQ